MSNRTILRSVWEPLHSTATVTALPAPATNTDGVAVPAAWKEEMTSSVLVRISKASAAQTLTGVQFAVMMDNDLWYLIGPILNGGTTITLTSIGYVAEIPNVPATAKRMALVGTAGAAGAFVAEAALLATQY